MISMENRAPTGYPSIDKPWLKNYPDGAAENVATGIDMRAYDFRRQRDGSFVSLTDTPRLSVRF